MIADDTPEEMTIHPAAEAFPRLPDDELQRLAADIKAHGLNEPIMLSHDGRVLLDGRNRLAACELAGVEPRYDWLPQSADQRAHIVSANIKRRHISKGQQALALALIYPEVEKGGRGKNIAARKGQETGGFSSERLRQARVIARYADLADMVKAGELKFDMAFEEAQQRDRIKDNSAHYLKELRTHAPDLAGQVSEEHLNLQEAWLVYENRKKEAERREQHKRAACLTALTGFFASTTSSDNAEFLQDLEELLKKPDFEAALNKHLRLDTIDRAAARVAMINGAKALLAVLQKILEDRQQPVTGGHYA